ncbi:MAG: DUF4390 domain-containing protein [Nitrospiraceae bacterium]|nr:DUF4390 domain-containing protein [Nitrospiraceae bacterium]
MKIIKYMLPITLGLRQKTAVLAAALFCLIAAAVPCSSAIAPEKPILSQVTTSMRGHDLMTAMDFRPGSQLLGELREGVKKELTFYVDLLRVWKIWPDEFVTGRKFTRILSADPIKNEFICETIENNIKYRKRFKDFESMTAWAFSLDEFRLASTKELEPGIYFVRLTIESKIRKLPSILKAIMIIPETEFSINADSARFSLPR